MALVVNTNVASLNAQRNLNNSQNLLKISLQRISSGLRVNSAKDDAAGMAISNRLTAQVRGFNQAARNAADAVSLSQTGEGALAEVTNNLQRMRELAIQSRNATNTDSDRQSLDAEFQQLLAENDRVADLTSFNGRKILDGSLGSSVFQVGANVGETISVDVSSSMRTNSIGLVATTNLAFTAPTVKTATVANFAALTPLLHDPVAATNGELKVNGADVNGVVDGANGLGSGSAKSIGDAIQAIEGTTSVTATVSAATATITNTNFGNFALNDVGTDDNLTFQFRVNDVVVATHSETTPTISTQNDLITAINSSSQTTGVVATLQSNNDILLTAQDGRNIEIGEQITTQTAADADTVTGFFGDTISTTTNAVAALGNTFKGTISLSSNVNIQVTDANAGDDFFASVTNDGVATQFSASAIAQSNVLSATNADDAVRRIDQALTDVDVLRGTFGAVQSRFESTIRNLQTASENASAANSRILDADFAAETAALTRAQILQQAGIAILSQANSLPQNARALLQ